MRQIKTHAFRGSRYKVKHSNLLRGAGDLGRSNYEKKAIYIPHDGDTKDELDTIIHEALHLAYPFLTEDEVERGANELTGLLWRLDWRKE